MYKVRIDSIMENKDKYYTPDIEEFHVGFEFEIRNSSDEPFEWEKCIINDNFSHTLDEDADSDTYIKELKYGWIRVKYLDREDIESLGFKLEYYSDEDNRSLFRKSNDFTLSYGWSDKILWITSRDLKLYGQFRGTIKNKSELKVLLKQLGI